MNLEVSIHTDRTEEGGKKLSINLSKNPNCPSFILWGPKFQLWLKTPGEHEEVKLM